MRDEPAILKIVRFLTVACVVVVSISAVLGFLAGDLWLLDFLSSFIFQYTLILLVCAAVLLILNSKYLAFGALVACIAVSIPVYTDFFGADRIDQSKKTYRIFFANVQFGNTDGTRIEGAIKKHNPDVVILAEGTRPLFSNLEERLVGYENASFFEGDEAFDISYFSKLNPDEEIRLDGVNAGVPSVQLAFNEEEQFQVIGTHPIPPLTTETFNERNAHLEDLAQTISRIEDPVVVVGDFNTSPWSVHARRFEQKAGVRNARKGHGIFFSWPIRYAGLEPIIAPLRIPIDHAFVSEGVQVVDMYQVSDIGSDHVPFVIDIQIQGE